MDLRVAVTAPIYHPYTHVYMREGRWVGVGVLANMCVLVQNRWQRHGLLLSELPVDPRPCLQVGIVRLLNNIGLCLLRLCLPVSPRRCSEALRC